MAAARATTFDLWYNYTPQGQKAPGCSAHDKLNVKVNCHEAWLKQDQHTKLSSLVKALPWLMQIAVLDHLSCYVRLLARRDSETTSSVNLLGCSSKMKITKTRQQA
jgi:hypothetical protein